MQEVEESEAIKVSATGRKRKAAATKKPAKKKKKEDFKPNMLDMTWIHPESYTLTHR